MSGSPTLDVTRDTILTHARALPASPQVLGGLCELLQDVNTDLDQIADQIRVDSTLSARVIKMSNSVVFGGGVRVGSVDEAVNRVGFAEVVRLVGAATAAGLVDKALAAYRIDADPFREAMLVHALAAEALAGPAGLDGRTAYAGGLLRGIGMMILERVARNQAAGATVYDPATHATYRDWEYSRFGVMSVDVTTTVLDDWRFPPELVGAMELHLFTRPAAIEDRLACVLNLAGAIAVQTGHALPGESRHWVCTPEKLAALELDADQYEMAVAQTQAQFARQRAALY